MTKTYSGNSFANKMENYVNNALNQNIKDTEKKYILNLIREYAKMASEALYSIINIFQKRELTDNEIESSIQIIIDIILEKFIEFINLANFDEKMFTEVLENISMKAFEVIEKGITKNEPLDVIRENASKLCNSYQVTALTILGQLEKAKELSNMRIENILNNKTHIDNAEIITEYTSRIHCLYKMNLLDEALIIFSKLVSTNNTNQYKQENTHIINQLLWDYKSIDCAFYEKLDMIRTESEKNKDNDIELAILENPHDPNNYVSLGDYYSSLDGKYQYEKALENYNKAIELTQDNSEYYSKRCFAFEMLNDYQNALLDINKSIELQPYKKEYRTKRCAINQIIKTKKSYLNGIEEYKYILENFDNDTADKLNTYFIIASMYYELGEYNSSIIYLELINNFKIEDVNEILLINPHAPNIHLMLAKNYEKKDEYEKSIHYYILAYNDGFGWLDFETDLEYTELIHKKLLDFMKNKNLTQNLIEKIKKIL